MPNNLLSGPSSTPQLYLENQYRLLQKQAADWEKSLQAQGLNEEDYANEIGQMQEQITEQVTAFQAKAQELRQTQSMMDLGIIGDPAAGMEAMWAAVLPKEVRQAMFPKPETESRRAPFSTGAMKGIAESVEEFTKDVPKTTLQKRYGPGGIDILKRDIRGRSQKDILEKYQSWKRFIGYADFTAVQKRQVDTQWDDWVAAQGKSWKWNTASKTVRAERASGPLTRAYGSQFRRTPTGPLEATNPLQNSIARSLPKKKKQPTAEELRSEGTQESYQLGKNLGYWD